MKVAIHNSSIGFSGRWIEFCDLNGIEYKLVNAYDSDIISQLKDCDAFMWHHSHQNPRDILFAKQLLYSLQESGKKVFPDHNTCWHFDDKVGQKYLLEAIGAPIVPTYVFYSKNEALNWASTTVYPKVFKLRRGAGSSSVRLIKSRREANKISRKAFGSGFQQYNKINGLKERIRRYREGNSSLLDIIKGFFRLLVPADYVKTAGKEKGYVYFQDFIKGNSFDVRVIVIDDKAFAIRRLVRKNDFRASGSGNILYDRNLFDENTIKLSFDLALRLKSQCVAFDYVFDNNRPLVVEISYGFSPEGYDSCPGYWDLNMTWHEGKFNPYGWMVEEVIKM